MGESESTTDYEAKMKERGREIQEGRVREKEAGAHMLQTGQGGPEAEERSREMGAGEHTMQTEAASSAKVSKEGFAMAGSRGTETVKRSKEQNR
jgi:hypothetical protein